MRSGIQYWARRADRPALIEFDHRNHAAADAVIKLLDKDVSFSVLLDRERIRIESNAVVRQFTPSARRMSAKLDHIGAVDHPPTDTPVRREKAQPIERTDRTKEQRFGREPGEPPWGRGDSVRTVADVARCGTVDRGPQ